jgi:16S rRNA (uracil1498-N3)-methyltransferase
MQKKHPFYFEMWYNINMHHIFINENEIDLSTKTINIVNLSENYNHLVKSLRVKVNENILCSVVPFNSSFDYRAIITNISDKEITLMVVENVMGNELPVNINLYQGISKYDKFEFIIEKSVELGVSTITPVATEYCVAKIVDKKSEKKIDRFNKISRSAAEQSKRHIIPKVNEPIDYEEMIKRIVKNKGHNLLFYENAAGIADTKRIIRNIIEKTSVKQDEKTEINVIIGPEGGFSESEIEIAKCESIDIVSLGDRILRTETAAITALSILMYEFNTIS